VAFRHESESESESESERRREREKERERERERERGNVTSAIQKEERYSSLFRFTAQSSRSRAVLEIESPLQFVQFVRPRCLVKIYYSAGRAPLSGRSRPIGPLSRKSSVCFSNVANETSLGAGFMTARGVAAAFSVTFAPLNPVIAKPQAPPPARRREGRGSN